MGEQENVPENKESLENEPLIDSSFRRLMIAINNERDALRLNWKSLKDEQALSRREAIQVRAETDEYCQKEKDKIDALIEEMQEEKRKVGLLMSANDTEIISLNVSGSEMEVPAKVLKAVKESYLSHMFSPAFIEQLPQKDGRYLLDFHPECFKIIVNYLHSVHCATITNQPVPATPYVHSDLKVPMSVLVDALKLEAFSPPNLIKSNGTSLITDEKNTVTATVQGWQVTHALYPMNPAKDSGFTVRILKNPDPRGGLAVGLVGKPPAGAATHQLVHPSGALYNSNNGIVMSQAIETNDTKKGLPFKDGTVIVVKYMPKTRKVQWFVNGQSVGQITIKSSDDTAEMFPCFALFTPEQMIQVDFKIHAAQSAQ